PGAAARAAATAAEASSCVPWAAVPRTCPWACGCTTSKRSPDAMTCFPPITEVSSRGFAARSASAAVSSARSGLLGAYCSTGSLTGSGTWVTASIPTSWHALGLSAAGVVGGDRPLAGAHPPRLLQQAGDLVPVRRRRVVELDAHPAVRPHVGRHEVACRVGAHEPQ